MDVNMATYRSGKGQRGGEYRKREWSSPRDHNKSGSSSPGPRRSDSPSSWRAKHDYNKEHHRENHKTCAKYLSQEWKKVEQDLIKDQRVEGTVEYVEKMPTEVNDGELCDVEKYLKDRKEKAMPD